MGKRGPIPGHGGRPKKPLAEKIAEGNPGGRKLTVVKFNEDKKIESNSEPSEFLCDMKGMGISIGADEIYRETWKWLNERGCAELVSEQLIERYAACVARWKQCEESISKEGLLAKHPTTGQPMKSPFVDMSSTYLTQAGRIWAEIYGVVQQNCAEEYKGTTPGDDMMESLLRRNG